jgi:hypothetical protein
MSDPATERWEWSNYSDHIQLVRNGVLVRTLDPDYLNALETELKTLRAKAELADEAQPLIKAMANCLGNLSGFDVDAEAYRAWDDATIEAADKTGWLARYRALTQPAGEGQTNA